MEIELLLLSKQKRHWVSLLVYFNRFMAPKAIYTETLCTISSWAMDPPGPTLEPPMPDAPYGAHYACPLPTRRAVWCISHPCGYILL